MHLTIGDDSWELNKEFTRVELHLHMDGSVRAETLYDTALRRKLLPDDVKTVDDIQQRVRVGKDCRSLADFLDPFYFFLPFIQGDAEAIERIAYELCESQASQKILYTEARYSPQLLQGKTLTPKQVVELVNKGLLKGCKEFGVYVTTILCCMRHEPKWSMECVDLAQEFEDSGFVCGIDLAGDESKPAEHHVDAFRRAKELNINRTVHAGESGSAENVFEAISTLHAQRIGHGYNVISNSEIYKLVKDTRIHLECCPTSSLQTSAVSDWIDHPIRQFARDSVNFSLSSDDPAVCNTNLRQEMTIAKSKLDLNEHVLWKTTFNAIESSFSDDKIKKMVLDHVTDAYQTYTFSSN